MPFQSEKQRRYLWANEPKIARDWSEKYGSRVKKAQGDVVPSPWELSGSPGYQYKTNLLNQYKDIGAQADASLNRGKLSYTDSPIFNRGYEAWDPTGMGSGIISNYAIPAGNWMSKMNPFSKDYSITSGKAGGVGGPTAAGFASHIVDPILSGNATGDERLKFANTFGHEMAIWVFNINPKMKE